MGADYSFGRAGFRNAMLRSEFDLQGRVPDPALDEMTELAAALCLAEFAYLGWMDFNRVWLKSCYGFSAVDLPREATACRWVVESARPLVIGDAILDDRLPAHGLEVPGGGLCRSYAGVPLFSGEQRVLGTLAILSPHPQRFGPEHLSLLEALARQVTTRLELYQRIREHEQAQRAHHRTERELAVERSFITATLDAIPSPVLVLDTAGRIVRFNQPCARLTGLDLAGAAGRFFVQHMLLEEDWPKGTASVAEAAAGRISGPHESVWRAAGGYTRFLSWSARPLHGPQGEVQYVIVSGQDITEQREAEKALLSSEARYRQVVESSLGFVFTSNRIGIVTSLNAYTADCLGYRTEDLIGRPLSDLVEGQGAAALRDCLRTLELQEEWQGVVPIRRRDGGFRHIAFRSRRIELRGEHPFLLHHGVDITEQHEAEVALRLATRKHQLILDSVADGIYGVDLEGRVTFINPAGARALGYTPEELVGRGVLEVIHHSHADGAPYSRLTSPILQAMRHGQSLRRIDEVFWCADGSSIPVEYTASPLVEDGSIAGMVVAFQDVSDRRQLEKMKDEFISTVSHELRTPLTALRGSLGLLSTGNLQKYPEKQRQMIEMAIGNCDRLVRLVNDIVDFDRVQRGRMSLRRVPVPALDLLRRAIDVTQNLAHEAQIGFRLDAHTDSVMVDEDRALQVLNELITNAIKFSPPATLIRLSALPEGRNDVCFSVEDQGSGIEPAKLERIFDRFEQGDASDSRALGGTGLGLALCRSIVEQHGGRIWVESTPGRGSRFSFTLQRAEPASER